MKNFKQFAIAIIGLLLLMSPIATMVSQLMHVSWPLASAVTLGIVIAIFSLPAKKLSAFTNVAGVEREIWVNYIVERFWKQNGFLKRAYSDDDKVLAGKVVHIPNPGSLPVVTRNRGVFPAAAVRRTDTDIVFALDEYTTAPTHIEDAEKVEPSYDKIDSVFGDHAGYLAEYVANDLILKWLDEAVTSPFKYTTTGGPTALATAATAPAATGNRLAFHHKDLKKLQTKFNIDNVPANDRQVLLDSNMLDQLTDSLSDSQYRDFSQYFDAKEGRIGRLYGFDILDRSSVAIASNTNAIKALGAAGAATDNVVSLAWQKDCVTRAMGEVKFFEDPNRPEYYGDIYSALLRMGARRRRADDKGVIAIIQGAAA